LSQSNDSEYVVQQKPEVIAGVLRHSPPRPVPQGPGTLRIVIGLNAAVPATLSDQCYQKQESLAIADNHERRLWKHRAVYLRTVRL